MKLMKFSFWFFLVLIIAFYAPQSAIAAAPNATNLSAAETYTEDTPLNLVDIVTSDDDGDPLTVTLTLSSPAAGSLSTATSGAVTSTYSAGTGVWTASGPISDVNTLLAGLIFTPALNYNSSFVIATSVTDGVASATGTKTMTGIAVNDAPTATNLSATESYTEDAISVDLVDIVASDVDGSTISVTLTLSDVNAGSLTTGTSGAVTSTFSAGVWNATGAISSINTLLASLTFIPSPDYASNFTITTSVSDGAAAATGSKAIIATSVNDAPILDSTKSPALSNIEVGSGAPTGAVGTLVSSLVDFATPAGQVDNITDVDSGAQLGIAIIAVDSANFTCYYTINSGSSWASIGAVSTSSARLLASASTNRIYCAPNGETTTGTYSDVLTFKAWDQTAGVNGSLASATSSGGTTAFSTTSDTVSIIVAEHVNSAPVAVDDEYSVLENSSGVSLDVLGNDTDADNDELTITEVSVPNHGGDAQVILSGQYIGYTPAADFYGTETFTYTISDGTDTDTATVTITILQLDSEEDSEDVIVNNSSSNSVGRYSWSLPPNSSVVIVPSQSTNTQKNTAYNFSRVLRRGMKGDDVVALQQFLGVTPVPSKIFGPKTRAAVIAFQKTYGLIPDGVVGPKTAQKIRELSQ